MGIRKKFIKKVVIPKILLDENGNKLEILKVMKILKKISFGMD